MKELCVGNLIKRSGRFYSIHRIVQEAISFHDVGDHQKSFAQTARLVYEQLPKVENPTSIKKREMCQDYVLYGVHLTRKFSEYTRYGLLNSTVEFVALLGNCAA